MLLEHLQKKRGVVVEADVVKLHDLVPLQDQLVGVLLIPQLHRAEPVDVLDDGRHPIHQPLRSVLADQAPAHGLVNGLVQHIR